MSFVACLWDIGQEPASHLGELRDPYIVRLYFSDDNPAQVTSSWMKREPSMKAISSFILASIFILSANFIYAQSNYNRAILGPASYYKPYTGPREKNPDAPGMETVKIGNTTVVAPEGMKIYEGDGQIILEETDAYMGRRFKVIDDHLKEMDETLGGLKKEIEDLKNKKDEP